MVERCDESSSMDVCLAQTETLEINHEGSFKMARREECVTAAVLEVSPDTAVRIPEGELTKMAEECGFGGSCPSTEDHVKANHHHFPVKTHLTSNSVADERAPAVKPPPEVLQNDSFVSPGPALPDFRHHVLMDDCREANALENTVNSSPLSLEKGDLMQSGESLAPQQLKLHPQNAHTGTGGLDGHDAIIPHQAATTVECMEEKMLYHSVLHQMQQQQKLKGGRKVKRKTLIKMAKLFVIAKGWDSEMMEVSESNGPLEENKMLREDAFTSLVTPQCDTIHTNSPKDEENYDQETSKKKAKEESKLLEASGLVSFTNPLNKSDIKQESRQHSQPVTAPKTRVKIRKTDAEEDAEITCDEERPETASKRKEKVRKNSSATIKKEEDTKITCKEGEQLGNYPAEISRAPKQQAFKQRPDPRATRRAKTRNNSSVVVKEEEKDTKITCENFELSGRISAEIFDIDAPKKQASKPRPVTAPKKRNIHSVALEEGAKITRDNVDLLGNMPEISNGDAPNEQALKQRAAMASKKRGRMRKISLGTLKEEEDTKITRNNGEAFKQAETTTKRRGKLNSLDACKTQVVKKRLAAASRKRRKMKTVSSVTIKEEEEEDTKVTSENSELSGYGPAEISCVDTVKQKSKTASKKTTSTKSSSVTLTEEEDTKIINDVSELSGSSSAGISIDLKRPEKASKWKMKIRNNGSVTQEEDAKITCENSEPPGNIPADISSLGAPEKQAFKQKRGLKRKQRPLPQTSTECNDVMMQGASCFESLLAGSSEAQDTIVIELDTNVDKEDHHEREMSVFTSPQNKISPDGSVLSAATSRKTPKKTRRRNGSSWTGTTRPRRPRIAAADVEISVISREKMISLVLKDKNDVKQTLTADTGVKQASKISPQRHRQLKSQKPLRCSFCGRSFRHISALTLHRRIHMGEKPYRCQACSKRFSQLSKLKTHSKVHSEPRGVVCPCCSETFKSQEELISHFHVHMKSIAATSEQQVGDCLDSLSHKKPLRYSGCFEEFPNRGTLKMHRRTHGGNTRTVSLNAQEKPHQHVKPYSCDVCWKGFNKLQELKHHANTHPSRNSFKPSGLHQEKQDAALVTRREIDGFLISQSVEGQIVTPVYFKCPICKQLHRHWCQYTLHLQTHTHNEPYTCATCRQKHHQAAGTWSHCMVCCRNSGEERACRSSLSDIWREPEAPENQVLASHLDDQSGPPDEEQKVEAGETEVVEMQLPPPSPGVSRLSVNDGFGISAPGPSSASDRASRLSSNVHARSPIRKYCSRYPCGRCGKPFSTWNKLQLHQRLHRRSSRSYSCSRCDLEFCFLGSYIDHLQEHAARTPHARPSHVDTSENVENLSAHISERHKKRNFLKCGTCGKNFSTLRNLKKHKLLHRRAISRRCLSCGVSFSSSSVLKTHLKTHRRSLTVLQPARLIEPLSFPYNCSKCSAKFSSADVLQAHQVCHFTAGRKMESVAAFIPSQASEDSQGVVSELSQRIRRLPVCNTRHLFRYPHPDLLYVVPDVSSEPPAVVSDTEEEQQEIQDQSPSITTSASSTVTGFNRSAPSSSHLPQSSSLREPGSSEDHQDHTDQSSLPQDSSDSSVDFTDSDSESDESLSESLLLFTENKIHSCTICMEPFKDVSKLHEHYIDHARRM